MEKIDLKKHWENIYQTKELKELSWYQEVPAISLDYLKEFGIPKTAKIIDVGGGDSFFVDYLIDLDYQDITVLDISAASLDRAKQRLGNKSEKVKWIIADVTKFTPTVQYDFWHDRAAFHFLTQNEDIQSYVNTINNSIKTNGVLVIGTFSEQGPKKCSGLEIKQYSENLMNDLLKMYFKKVGCKTIDHKTPSGFIQNFIFCSFRKLETK